MVRTHNGASDGNVMAKKGRVGIGIGRDRRKRKGEKWKERRKGKDTRELKMGGGCGWGEEGWGGGWGCGSEGWGVGGCWGEEGWGRRAVLGRGRMREESGVQEREEGVSRMERKAVLAWGREGMREEGMLAGGDAAIAAGSHTPSEYISSFPVSSFSSHHNQGGSSIQTQLC